MQPHEYFNAFKCLFSWTRLSQSDDELRYFFRSKSVADVMGAKANEIIMEYKLPLQAVVETWSNRQGITEIALVVTIVPEDMLFRDEVLDDEGLSEGWWNK